MHIYSISRVIVASFSKSWTISCTPERFCRFTNGFNQSECIKLKNSPTISPVFISLRSGNGWPGLKIRFMCHPVHLFSLKIINWAHKCSIQWPPVVPRSIHYCTSFADHCRDVYFFRLSVRCSLIASRMGGAMTMAHLLARAMVKTK